MIVMEHIPEVRRFCSHSAQARKLAACVRRALDGRIDLASLGPLHLATVEKTLFSMATPEVLSVLETNNSKLLVFIGIEVRRTASTIWSPNVPLCGRMYACCNPFWTYSNGMSSCNKEVPLALERMCQAGAQITTSEGMLFVEKGITCIKYSLTS